MDNQDFLKEAIRKSDSEFESINKLMRILDDLTESENVTLLFSVTTGNL